VCIPRRIFYNVVLNVKQASNRHSNAKWPFLKCEQASNRHSNAKWPFLNASKQARSLVVTDG